MSSMLPNAEVLSTFKSLSKHSNITIEVKCMYPSNSERLPIMSSMTFKQMEPRKPPGSVTPPMQRKIQDVYICVLHQNDVNANRGTRPGACDM